jgi:AbrB family looped-hinge helix DNA binding protein
MMVHLASGGNVSSKRWAIVSGRAELFPEGLSMRKIFLPHMARQLEDVEFTRASSKGQVVIPRGIRKRLDIKEGSLLAVAAERDLIILKKVDSKMSDEDLKTMRRVEEAWKDIEEGRYGLKSKDAFFEELKDW